MEKERKKEEEEERKRKKMEIKQSKVWKLNKSMDLWNSKAWFS